jgi:dihydroorotate dehydrogenase
VYSLIRPLLFALDAERSHDLTLGLLRAAYRMPGARALLRRCYAERTPPLPVEVMGLRFPNPVGLAAGLDKEARCLAPLFDFGFGFLELGTVTPQSQPGNPKPRLFRLTRHAAIINRMGFNSSGLAVFLANLAAQPRRGLIGINLGKNKLTPDAHAIDDYLIGLRAVYAHADYVTLNISSPNTPGLRALQDEAPLAALLGSLKHEQGILTRTHGRYVPIALKIAPDLDDTGIDAIARLLLTHNMDGVIATNTTITRPGLEQDPRAREPGGLSGQPLRALSTQVIRRLHARLQGRIPIIGVGGIGNAEDAWEKLVAGADLIQLYTAFIYRGPGVVSAIIHGLAEKVRTQGVATVTQAVRRARGDRETPE